ncbi:MAG: DUF6400 family protein [Pseudonocardiaceae bacterium]
MPNLVSFDVDLTAHEGARLAVVLATLGADWDPTTIYAGEAEAHRMLYSQLDPGQQSSHDMLVAEGVLPPRGWPT